MTVNDGDFTGEIGLLRLNRVKAPLEKTYADRTVRIVDDGYYWLQLAAPDVPYWLTAMYDDKGRFIQFYFDISDRNVILPDGKAYFIDLLLDVVMAADGGIYLLDEDELSSALAKDEITQAQYDGAHEAARGIVAMLGESRGPLLSLCQRYFDLLRCKLVYLRSFDETDAQFISSEWADKGRMHGCAFPADIGQVRALIAQWLTELYEGRYFKQFAVVTGDTVVGMASIYEQQSDTASVGIIIDEKHWRKGFASQAIEHLKALAASKGYQRFISSCRTDNEASMRLHEKCGFRKLGKTLNRKGNEIYEWEHICILPI